MWELQVKFYLGQNEDHSPGDSISDSSEKLLQRGNWEGPYICDFGEGGRGTCNWAHFILFFSECFCWFQGAVITMKNFSAFLDMRRCKSWAHRISSWKYLSEDLSWQFFPEQSASFLLSTLNSFQEVLKISSFSSTWLNPCRGRWQVPMASANLQLTDRWHYQRSLDSTFSRMKLHFGSGSEDSPCPEPAVCNVVRVSAKVRRLHALAGTKVGRVVYGE